MTASTSEARVKLSRFFAGSQAHARRKHFDAQDSDLARATVALAYIRRLYQVERQAKDLFAKQADGPDARSLPAIRLELRQEHSLPVLREFET
jgi:hypothetical protein